MEVRVSKHAYDRVKERLGLNRNAAKRIAVKAYEKGLSHREMSGKLEKYVSAVALAHMTKGSRIMLYGEHVFCFAVDGDDVVLITVYELPKFFRNSSLGKQRNKKKEMVE